MGVVDDILKFNAGFDAVSLRFKLQRLLASPFSFFRGTFHLFARDLERGPLSQKLPARPTGWIVGDLHTENFGTFRAVTGDIVYDINDFDETTQGPYSYDLGRLATSVLLAATDNGLSFGRGVDAAEAALGAYLEALGRMRRLKRRAEFERQPQPERLRELLHVAKERDRAEFIKTLARERAPGAFALRPSRHYLPVAPRVRKAVTSALPDFFAHCLQPDGSVVTRYTLEDVAFRIAGCGSLGRARYALLFGKGSQERESFSSLRLLEWKAALDSALDAPRPRASPQRARVIVDATRAFQLYPRLYLGHTRLLGKPMQTRQIGANDVRFQHREFSAPERLEGAARIFGEITARVHLLGSLGATGPRELTARGGQDGWRRRLLAFALACADRTLEGYQELQRRRAEVAAAWQRGSTAR